MPTTPYSTSSVLQFIPTLTMTSLNHNHFKCIFLSFKMVVKWFKLYYPKGRKITFGRDIIFNECAMLRSSLTTLTPMINQA